MVLLFEIPEIHVRPYRSADLDGTIAVFLRAIRETASADYSAEQIEAWAQVDHELWAGRRGSRPTWVADLGGQVVGFTDLEDDGHLDMMYVHPELVGRGVATALLAAAEDHALHLGLNRIFAEVSLTARDFFERKGFDLLELERVFRNGQWFDRYKVEKKLSAGKGNGAFPKV